MWKLVERKPADGGALSWRTWLVRTAWAMGTGVMLAGLLLAVGWVALRWVPLPATLLADQVPEVQVLDRSGRTLRYVRPDNQPFTRIVQYGEIPQTLIQATLSAEDRRFWQHPGVDWQANVRAAWQVARHRHVVSGGSTITQQLIKLATRRPRTLRTKLIEAVQALRLEQVWDKQRILVAYLNRLDYGNFNRGCAAAAQFYFAKPLRDLSPAECALLTGLPQVPSRLNPITHFDRAAKRQQWVLGQMRLAGSLSDEESRRAAAEPLRLAPAPRSFEAPHFVDLLLAMQQAAEDPQGPSVRQPGHLALARAHALAQTKEQEHEQEQDDPGWRTPRRWRADGSPAPLRTTLELDLNHFAETTLRQHLARVREHHVSNGAIVVLDNRTGDVLALVGSEGYFAPSAGQVNGAWAVRSPGSSLKPFTYLLALEHGATPATVVADVPTEFATATGLFAPVNYDRHCYGPMRYRMALANSLNISAVKVLASIGGPEPLQHLLQQCGLTTLDQSAEHYGLGLTIGNAEVRLLELANAYATLARLGQYRPYRLLLDGRASVLASPTSLNMHDIRAREDARPPGTAQVADPAAAYLIADILSDNDARSLAFGAESALRFAFPVACKTGTSSDFRDNWAFGYTPEFTVGIWVGNFDGSPMEHVSGVTGAAPILHDLFEHLHACYGTTWYATPANIVQCWVNPVTGRRVKHVPPEPGPDALQEKFLATNLPPLETPADNAAAESPGRVLLGSEYREWFASGDNWLGPRAALAPGRNSLRISFPLPGTTVYIDPDLPFQGRQLFLSAQGSEHLEWQSDSLRICRQNEREMALLTEGRHRITVHDPETKQSAQTWINVLDR